MMADRVDNRSRVLLVTTEPETTRTVGAALESSPRLALAGVCANLRDVVYRLECAPTPGVIVDIDPQPAQMLEELDLIITKFADTRFIVLSNTQGDGLLLRAMQAGARYFLTKEGVGSTLVNVLQEVLPKRPKASLERGTLITVLSASGGCGATTVAVNLADELRAKAGEPVLLVDLDNSYGAVAAYLGLRGRYGIADILAHQGHIDSQLISSSALSYSEGFHVLISPVSTAPLSPAPLRYDALSKVLNACKQAYRYTVVDAPRVPMDAAATLANASKCVLLVFQLTIKDLTTVKAILSGLTERGVPGEVILPLVSRYRKRNPMISLEEAELAIGGKPLERVSNDFRSALRSINYGQPLARVAPSSTLRQELRQLAIRIST